MTCSGKTALYSFVKPEKQLVTAQHVFLTDKKQDKIGQDVVSFSASFQKI